MTTTTTKTSTRPERSQPSTHPAPSRPKGRSSKRSRRPRGKRGSGVSREQQQTQATREAVQRSAHWVQVADWLDTVNDATLPSSARIVAHKLAEQFDQRGTVLRVEDARTLGIREHPEYEGKDEPGAEVPVYLAGARLLARHGFLDKQGTFVAIAEPAKWNRGQGPTRLRAEAMSAGAPLPGTE